VFQQIRWHVDTERFPSASGARDHSADIGSIR